VISGYIAQKSSVSLVLGLNGVLLVILALYFLLIQKKLSKL
jgi:hypothetical protein